MEIQIKKSKPKTYRDLGLTLEEFLEVVDFFRELMRLDQKGKDLNMQRVRLTTILRNRTREMIEARKSELQNELHSLEKFV